MSHTVPNPAPVPITFDPTAVVAEVMALLHRHGIDVVLGVRAASATQAAASLLEAMGVTPEYRQRTEAPSPWDYSTPVDGER